MNFGSFGGRIAELNWHYRATFRLQYFDDSASSITIQQSHPFHPYSIAIGNRLRVYDAALAVRWLVVFGYLFPIYPKSLIAFPEANLVIDLVAGLVLVGFD
jgi:hypothetical protein